MKAITHCRYFNGFSRSTCAAGVNYEMLIAGATKDEATLKPADWFQRMPCLGPGENKFPCVHYAAYTAEELAVQDHQYDELAKTLREMQPMIAEIKRKHRKVDWQGVIDCPACKRPALHVTHHGYNGYVWLRCRTAGCIQFME